MKKLIYIYSVIFLALFASCQDERYIQTEIENEDGFMSLNYTLDIPGYIATRSASALDVGTLSILTFDEDGSFLGRVMAPSLTMTEPDATGKGTGTARVPIDTRIMHFVVNHDWSNWVAPTTAQGKLETTLVPSLLTTQNVYWGRVEVANLYGTISVELLRNFAKLTVVDNTSETAGTNNYSEFFLDGYTLGNYASTGTVSVYGETSGDPFQRDPDTEESDVLTLPKASDRTFAPASELTCDMTPKYMFETENTEANPTYIIIKNKYDTENGKASKYYKLHLIKDQTTMIPWKIERNYHYIVTLHSFDGDPYSNGVSSFEEALNAPVSNNLYATIVQESPTISDNDKNRLVIDKMINLFTGGGTLNVKATYYTFNGTQEVNESDNISIRVVSGEDIFTSGPSIDGNGNITGTVKSVASGQQEAVIRVSKGNLTRLVKVITSEKYTFNPVTSPVLYTGIDDDVLIEFNIPDTYPDGLYPVKCMIEAGKLYPTGDDQNMLIVHEDNTYYYVYEAKTAGQQTVHFKTSFVDSNSEVLIKNEYFETASILLKSTETFTRTIRADGSFRTYPNSTITGEITVSYDALDGPGSTTITVSNGTVTSGTRDITIPTDVTALTLSYSGYTLDVSVAEFISSDNKVLINPDLIYVTLGAGRYRKVEASTSNIRSGIIEVYSADGSEKYDEFTTSSSTNNNNHNDAVLSLPNTLDDNTSVLLRHTSGADVFELVTTIADLKAAGNKDLVNTTSQYVTFGNGLVRYGTTRISNGTVSVYSADGETLYTTFTTNNSSSNNYTGTIKLPVGVESVRLVHKYRGVIYYQEFALEQLRGNNNKNLNLQQNRGLQVQGSFQYYRSQWRNIPSASTVIVYYDGNELDRFTMTSNGGVGSNTYISIPDGVENSATVTLSYTRESVTYEEDYTLTQLNSSSVTKQLR
ncbi:hypothetical protein M2480_003131 [Parabacteroides sp. PFB2-12]|uniref:hypothetical protein n=1 Tax=unclassified Parabacteroides TaxID=2649774 RepID=UPI002475B340|nr:MULTISPECIES: hypothetical protein [unclassified Parabacteroides]MDH6344216.1 hypothetical protein [Parabacteroides sp. PM6-13]MDH6392123.1 hypothetical protein [Parabacteroides sp. PFB2-12]